MPTLLEGRSRSCYLPPCPSSLNKKSFPCVSSLSRMERDSNPRYSYQYFGFQDRLFQPLRHPSSSRFARPIHPRGALAGRGLSMWFATLRLFLYDNMHLGWLLRSLRVIARERVRLANDQQVKDRSFCASTVARLVLGGSRATYRLRVPITPSLFF